MTFNFKKLLLTGTALVAVSAFSAPALAAAGANGTPGATVNGSTTTSTGATTGGAGAVATDPGASGAGGDGVDLGTGGAGTASFTGAIIGAGGAAAVAAGAAVTTDNGGAGGNGVWFNAENGTDATHLTTISNGVSIAGGAGNTGAAGNAGAGSVGGIGGIGVKDDANFSAITGIGTIAGGGGGTGGAGNAANNNGGAGAVGGDGILVSGNTSTLSETGNVSGGVGGAGGTAAGTGTGGAGKNGGSGYDITGNTSTISITANATGGNAGAGGSAVGAGTGGAGGQGGAGVVLGGTGETLTIGTTTSHTATVTGGAGVAAVTPGGGTAGAVGFAGTGISISGVTGNSVINYGTIVGGALTNGGAASSVAAITDTGTTGTSSINNHSTGVIGGTGVGNGIVLAAGKVLDSITNAGTIQTGTGEGIYEIGGAAGVTLLTNTGTIQATGATGNAIAIAGTGGIPTITNTGGTITSAGAGAANATLLVGANVGAGGITLTGGTLSNTDVADTTGVALNITTAQSGTIASSATISSLGLGGTTSAPLGTAVNFGFAGAQAFTNSGIVQGKITDGGTASIATVTNSGTITGNIAFSGAAADTVTQTAGTITGNIALTGNGVDTVALNGGSVIGNISTGTNADVITLGGGSYTGTINTSTGADTINVTGNTTTGGTITAANGATTVSSGKTFTINNAVALGTGTYTSTGATVINSTGSLTTSGATSVAVTTGSLTVNANSTVGALTNNGAVTIAGNTVLTAGSVAAGGVGNTWTFGVVNNAGAASAGEITAGAGAANFTNSTLSLNLATLATSTSSTLTSASNSLLIAHAGSGFTAAPANGTVLASTTELTLKADIGTAGAVIGGTGSANDLYAVITRNAVSTFSTSANNTSVGTVLDSVALTGSALAPFKTIENNLGAAPTAAAANNVLASVSPTVDGSAQTSAQNFSGQVEGLTNTHLAALRTGDADGMAAGSAADGTGAWLEGFGVHQDQSSHDATTGYSANTWGGAFGLDSAGLLDGGVIGVGFSYGDTTADSSNANTTSTDVKSYGIGIYGSTTLPQDIFLNGQVGYAFNDINQDRHNVGGAGGPTASAGYHSQQFSAEALAGRDYPVEGGMTVTPSVSAAYTFLDTGSYTETGSGANEHVDGNNLNNLGLGLGVDAGWKFKASNDGSVLKPSLHAGYTYEAIDDAISDTASFVAIPAAASFRTQGADPARNVGDVGAKIVFETVENWDLSAAYDFQFRSDYNASSGWLKASTKF